MKFKDGTRFTSNMHFVTPFVITVVDSAYMEEFGHEAVCTSANDRIHQENSLHYKGAAWDFRIWRNNDFTKGPYPASELALLKDKLNRRLGDLFDIVLERDHIHVEFDPKAELVE